MSYYWNSKLIANHSCRAWLINSRALARKVRNVTCSAAHQIKDCGANRECPNCHCRIDNSDVSWNLNMYSAFIPFLAVNLYTKDA